MIPISVLYVTAPVCFSELGERSVQTTVLQSKSVIEPLLQKGVLAL